MIAWELLGTAVVPARKRPGQSSELGAGTELRLFQRGEEFSLRVDTWELMNSRSVNSEQELATLACARLRDRDQATVLIGGLGMGFTLRAALDELGPESTAVVAELVPEVVEWNRGPLAHLAGNPLDDPRVKVETCDVAELLRENRDSLDAILLDVDNGPDGTRASREGWIYSQGGLQAARSALRPHGVLTIWASGANSSFTRRLEREGFQVEVVRSRGNRGKGHQYWIWVACRPN